jgi:hypothetical protein
VVAVDIGQSNLAVSPYSRNNWKEFFSSKSREGNSQKVIMGLVPEDVEGVP